jgi:DNA-binding NarL/FixJ family response regulator
MEDLFKSLKSSQFIKDELNLFHSNFDKTFLQIYPTFVEEFNALFPAHEQQVPKHGELLTTELRVYALIRLGINDSTKIADFLRYSITTVYTYRSKLKHKSLYPENFEQCIMKIGS